MAQKNKQQIQIEQQFLYTLAQIVESFPQYSIAQHLTHFMRRKGEAIEVYFWKDEFILTKIEEYYDELKGSLSTRHSNNEDYYYEEV